MPTFVDFAGMNTLVSSSIDGNTLSSGKNSLYTEEQIDDVDAAGGQEFHPSIRGGHRLSRVQTGRAFS